MPRLTMAQALIAFLKNQHVERDGQQQPFFAGCWGIFGHGNVAGVGQALLQAELEEPGALPYYQARNEQAMVHAASAFARTRNRLSTLAWWRCCGPRPACPEGVFNVVHGDKEAVDALLDHPAAFQGDGQRR